MACGHCGRHMHPIGACPNMHKRYTAQSRKPHTGRNLPPQKNRQLKRKAPQEIEVDHHPGKGHRTNNKDAPIKQCRKAGNRHVVKPAGLTSRQAKAAAKNSRCLLTAGVMLALSVVVVHTVTRALRRVHG